MKHFVAVTVLLALVGFAVPSVSAKPLARILKETGLSPEDFDLLQASARSLYDTPSPQLGKTVSWTNDTSGSHGTARLASVRGNCVYIQHMVYAPDAVKPRELRTPYCKAADGQWLLQL